jgi:hypothetical protein
VADDLVLGPVLRRVAGTSATIWAQTARPATVRVRAGDVSAEAATFRVAGHHFALVILDGLPAGAATAYEMDLDGVKVWPPAPNSPPSHIRTRDAADERVHVVFGSCRESTPGLGGVLGPDALEAYATRLAGAGPQEIPDSLLMLGDQVYADVTSRSMRAWLNKRRPFRRRRVEPPKQVVDFTEYARLYRESWTEPRVRWLLSTVSTVMIFDDHEIIDDWNTSAEWRRDQTAMPWWHQRITAGLASYWVFQHAGNLAPAALRDDPTYRALLKLKDLDASPMLHEFAGRADAAVDDPDAADPYRWSYAFDLGRTRVVMLDNRGARVLDAERRSMLAPREWAWFRAAVAGEYDHLLVGCSLPWLMPYGIHDLEAASEHWSRGHDWRGRLGERLRRTFDLEHWPAFAASFQEMATILAEVGAEKPAASVSVLSGDVHHSYVARADYGPDVTTPVYQLTCSPFRQQVPLPLRPLMRLAWWPAARVLGRTLVHRHRAGRRLGAWDRLGGPHFGNAIATVRVDGRHARCEMETATRSELKPIVATDLS